MPRRLRIGHGRNEIVASAASFAVSGQPAVLRRGASLVAQAAAYAVVGRTAAAVPARRIAAAAGVLSAAGQTADLARNGPFAVSGFVGAQGTELSAADASWQKVAGTPNVVVSSAGRATPDAVGPVTYLHSSLPATADYRVGATLRFFSGNTATPGVVGRGTPTGDGYNARYTAGSTNAWQLFKIVGGVETQLGGSFQQVLSFGGDYLFELRMEGDVVALHLNGSDTPAVAATDSDISAAGRAGIRFRATSTTPSLTGSHQHLDDFVARNVAAQNAWSNPATWGGAVPADGENVTVAVGDEVSLDVSTANLGLLVVAGTLRVDTTKPGMLLRAKGIVIEAGGKLLCGTPSSPYSGFSIELDGVRPDTSVVGPSHVAGDASANNPSDAFLGHEGASRGIVVMGELRIYATRRQVLRTFLANHSIAGAVSHTTADTVDWPAGSSVLFGPTDFYDNSRTEVLALAADASGTTLQTTAGLAVGRWGRLQYATESGMSLSQGSWNPADAANPSVLDERAEVALLERSCEIRAPNDAAFSGDRYGVSVMAMGQSAVLALVGVRLLRCGQGGALGRYPVHWHMMSYDQATGETLGSVPADNRMEDCVVQQSWNRAITLHGVRGVTVLNNVCHDARGHSLFLEDGSEEDNVVVGNWMSEAKDPNSDTPVTVSCAPGTPAVFSRSAHGFQNGRAIRLGGSYPAGFTPGSSASPNVYWVVNAAANTFELAATPGGAAVSATTAGSSLTAVRWWAIKLHDVDLSTGGASGAWISNANNEIRLNRCFSNRRNWWQAYTYPKKWQVRLSGSAAFTTGTPGKVKWTAHGHVAGQTLVYTGSGTAAGGLTHNATYWVKNPTSNDFELSATPSGAPIAITSLGSGEHDFQTGGCLGPSKFVPIIPFFTRPKVDAQGSPLYSQNVGHSAFRENNLLEFAPINERGLQAVGGFPAGAPDQTGPRFKVPANFRGVDTTGVFHQFILWKGQSQGYQNRVVNPEYRSWLQADTIGAAFFGATQEGFGNKLSATVIRESLNVTARPAGKANVDNAFASYHSALDFVGVEAVGYSADTPQVANSQLSPYGLLYGRSVMQTWDFYTNPVEMGFGRHKNWHLVNSIACYRTPGPNIINDDWDEWTGNQDVDTSTVVRRWALAGALYDHEGIAGTPRRYLSFNIPFCTYGLSSYDVLSPAYLMGISTPDHYYGVKPRADDVTGDVDFDAYLPWMQVRRLTPALAELGGAGSDWDILKAPSDAEMPVQYPGKSTFFRGSRHFACPRGGFVYLKLPDLGVQSLCVRHVIYNCSRKAGVDGQTADDVFYLVIDWSAAQVPRVFGSVGLTGSFPNFDYDPAWASQGRAAEFSDAGTLVGLTSGAVNRYWRDTANSRLVIKAGAVGYGFYNATSNPYSSHDRSWSLVVRRP